MAATTDSQSVATVARVHKQATATTIAAVEPATTTTEDYALAIELISDHNDHTASTLYHTSATAAKATTASTTEATFVAQTNDTRDAMEEHYANRGVHGGTADAVGVSAVADTVKSTNAATARTLVNKLTDAHQSHIVYVAPLSVLADGADTACPAEALNATDYKMGERVQITVRTPRQPLITGKVL